MPASGPGGDFETYIGTGSGTLYRLDLGRIYYLGKSRAELLEEAKQKEGPLIHVPSGLPCRICGSELSTTSVFVDGEEIVEAYEL
jgi:hypothetical protein